MRHLLGFLKPYRRQIGLAVALVFLQSLAELYLPTLMASIVDEGVVPGNTAHIWRVGGWMLVVAALGVAAAASATYFAARTANGFGRDVRRRVFQQVSRFSLSELHQLGTATLITRTTNDVAQVQQVVFMMMRLMISAPLMAVGGVVMAVSKDRVLSLVIVAVVPLLALVIGLIAAKAMPLFRALQDKIDGLNRIVRELLTGVRVVRAFNRSDYEHRRFTAANRDLTETAIRVFRLMGATMPLMMVLLNMTTVAVMWFGGWRVAGGRLQVGDLMAFIQYVMFIMFSLLMVSMMLVILPRAAVSASRIHQVLTTAPSIEDEAGARPVPVRRGVVEFRRVTFQYPGAEQPALQDISFRAEPGQTTAIIGGTGSGKTTLVHLLVRFFDPTGGQVLVDGVDVRRQTQADLRRAIGYVPQQAMLFSGTIADNIRYGREEATDEEIERAAAAAQALEFIRSLPEGFNTMVAQGGTNLSGGQRQRLTIARALVRRPRIYVFDDCFSALDAQTDAAVRAALRRETQDATVIIVAQRVSTVMHADQIIVLDEGKMAGIGTHQELLRTCPVYREIVISQLGEEAAA
ncbi:MAG: ABC transporter ATP-binding protein/permease [Limnochordales bacterium]